MQDWVIVAGGAGFVGSNLCGRVLSDGYRVICIDDVSTGRWRNVSHLKTKYPKAFHAIEQDIRSEIESNVVGIVGSGAVYAVMNLASPASPKAYLSRPVDTLEIGSAGTKRLLDFALKYDARFLQASTSEVYGDALEHPQRETYWGNVNPVGPRSVYDEAKRFGEALCTEYERSLGLDLRLPRIFNTYGPNMQVDDGRVISNFICQALRDQPLTLYGSGLQTRSFCFVDDLVEGLWCLARSSHKGPMNIGNPGEFTMAALARLVIEKTGSKSEVINLPLPADDPKQRKPDIRLANETIGWLPKVGLSEGLDKTIEYFREISLPKEMHHDAS